MLANQMKVEKPHLLDSSTAFSSASNISRTAATLSSNDCFLSVLVPMRISLWILTTPFACSMAWHWPMTLYGGPISVQPSATSNGQLTITSSHEPSRTSSLADVEHCGVNEPLTDSCSCRMHWVVQSRPLQKSLYLSNFFWHWCCGSTKWDKTEIRGASWRSCKIWETMRRHFGRTLKWVVGYQFGSKNGKSRRWRAGTLALLYARETHVVNPLTHHNILPSTSGNLKAYYIHILFKSEFIPSLPGVLTQQAIILFTE